jgi:molybdopterin-guanine dinucleotide biosynthesis protein A
MGRPKAWLPFGGETMLQRVVRVVGGVVSPVVVVAAPDQDVPTLPADVRIVRDEVEGRGPLQGLAAGLAALEGKADAAFLTSCDVPLLTPRFMRSLISLLGANSIAVPRVNDRLHPLAAAYRLSVLPHVRAMLAVNGRRMLDLFDRVPTRVVESHELADLDALRNVNTPDEYVAALAALATPEPPP